jgi:hypothetical protein
MSSALNSWFFEGQSTQVVSGCRGWSCVNACGVTYTGRPCNMGDAGCTALALPTSVPDEPAPAPGGGEQGGGGGGVQPTEASLSAEQQQQLAQMQLQQQLQQQQLQQQASRKLLHAADTCCGRTAAAR